MDYLMDLRQRVGHIPLVVVGVSLIVLNERKEILMIERSDNQFWGLPAGSVEVNEAVEETAKRELLEETGLQTKEVTLYNVLSGEDCFYTYPNGDQCSFVMICFYTESYSGEIITETNETTNCLFFAPEALPDKMVKHERLALTYFLKEIYPTLVKGLK